MKINALNSYNIYKNKASESAGGYQPNGINSENTRRDRNAIIRGSTTMPDKQMLALKSSVQSYISAPAGSLYLDAIREKVQGGAYHIPTDDLVNAIMLEE